MPNHVINEITLHGSEEEIQAVLKAVQKGSLGIGTIDFNKLLPMPPELNIEAGSRTDRGLKHYRDFVEVFTLGGTVNTEKLASIPPESEAAFLRQRPDIPPDEWELGKAAWNNIRRFGAPTWYDCFAFSHKGTTCLFTLFGWALFAAGVVVAIFDVAIEYQSGRANIKTTAINILKGFFACSLVGVVPVELYKFCITLQGTFSGDIIPIFTGSAKESLYRCGNERYLLQVIAPEYKAALFGKAGGR